MMAGNEVHGCAPTSFLFFRAFVEGKMARGGMLDLIRRGMGYGRRDLWRWFVVRGVVTV